MESERHITMTDPLGIALVALVALLYLGIRLVPRLVAGFDAYASASQIKREMDQSENLMLLDVRSVHEFTSEPGHLVGAINVPLDQLRAGLADEVFLNKARTHVVVTICRTDTRAAFAVRMLRRAGVKSVRVMSGGMMAWLEQDYPVMFGDG